MLHLACSFIWKSLLAFSFVLQKIAFSTSALLFHNGRAVIVFSHGKILRSDLIHGEETVRQMKVNMVHTRKKVVSSMFFIMPSQCNLFEY